MKYSLLELFEEREGFKPGLLVFVNSHPVDFEGGDVELEGMSRLQVLALEELIFLAEVYGSNIAHAETTACNLVGIGRTNAFEGGAYLGVAFGLLVSGIEETVGRNDEVGFLGDIKVFGGIDSALAQGFNFVFEDIGFDEDTVADNVQFIFVENAGGYNVQNVFGAVEF